MVHNISMLNYSNRKILHYSPFCNLRMKDFVVHIESRNSKKKKSNNYANKGRDGIVTSLLCFF